MAHSNFTNSSDHHDHDHDHEQCGTRTDEHELEQSQMIAHRLVQMVCKHEALQHVRVCLPYSERIKRPVVIPVWYHIIHSGSTGKLTDAEVEAQYEQVNIDFAGEDSPDDPDAVKMDISFKFGGATYTDNSAWFADMDRYETQAKQLLAVDNTYNFNQYFGDLDDGLLGFCYYPNAFAESSFRHGCVNLYSSIPGGATGNYNEGKTTTHETGHGIGLPHTFQNGCNGRGDYSSPICPQQRATGGCPTTKPTSCGCPDPINNYMDYSYDRCMTQFTSGQDQLANEQLFTYRPSLYLGQEGVDEVLSVLPGAWDEARAFGEKLELEHIARRHAKGYDLDL